MAGLAQGLPTVRCPWLWISEAGSPQCEWCLVHAGLFVSPSNNGMGCGCLSWRLGGSTNLAKPQFASTSHWFDPLQTVQIRKFLETPKCHTAMPGSSPLLLQAEIQLGFRSPAFIHKTLRQVHKLQNKILKSAGNYGRDLWSPPQHEEPQQSCRWLPLLLILAGKY